ncbi:IPExxxVDY family protein [Snuella lapsa]|uniref:IPExxxVDY family protein n=1 Tax=Snuella lapsa TaxID=870481 RepID=A0ABP6XW14_9FLAO
MAVHKLILEDVFEEEQYALIAIHCTIEDYRLAYLLNRDLDVKLSRKPTDIDFNNGASSFSIFEWEDEKQLTTWSLISNVCKIEAYQTIGSGSLFDMQEKITNTYCLVPEYKRVNYFLKIESEFNYSKEKYILSAILKIPQIATAYSIDINQLKSKDNLIFN